MPATVLDSDGFQQGGYARAPAPLEWIRLAKKLSSGFRLDDGKGGHRNLLNALEMQSLAARIGATLSPNRELWAVRALWFDKRKGSNWKVPWRQDLSIAVAAKSAAEGFGPWSIKEGVVHVQPPASILESMVAMRLHLDVADATNGALKVVPGSHRRGVLSPEQIEAARSDGVNAEADAGELIVMRPLLLHASSAAEHPWRRRVLHIEYSTLPAPFPLEWRYQVSSCRNTASQDRCCWQESHLG